MNRFPISECVWLFHNLIKCNVTNEVCLRKWIQWFIVQLKCVMKTIHFDSFDNDFEKKVNCFVQIGFVIVVVEIVFSSKNICFTFIQLNQSIVRSNLNEFSHKMRVYLSLNLRIKTPNNFRTNSDQHNRTSKCFSLSLTLSQFYK